MFSDESKFVVDFHDGRQWVWRRTGERYQPPAMIACNRDLGGSVTVRGGITMTGRTELHNCQGHVTGFYYRDNIMEPIVVPYARRQGNAFIFQGDNSRAHRARVACPRYLQFRRVSTPPWPGKSPDQSPIEHCGTSSGNVSGDSLTSHRTSTSWLICTPGGVAPGAPNNH